MRAYELLTEFQERLASKRGEQFYVFKNPSFEQVKNSVKGNWKGLYDPEYNDIWIWWAYFAHHHEVAGQLGLLSKSIDAEPIFIYADAIEFYSEKQAEKLLANKAFVQKIQRMYKHANPSEFMLGSVSLADTLKTLNMQ